MSSSELNWLDNWKPIFVNGVIPSEFRAAIAAEVTAAKKQGGINALCQLKADRIAHVLSTKANEWTREVDFINEHIEKLQQGADTQHE